MSKIKMTAADKIRAAHSGMGFTNGPDDKSVNQRYMNRVISKGYDLGRLNDKWMKRMKRDLLRGELVGSLRFYEFTKSGKFVDVGLSRGLGRTHRIKSERLLGNWRDYYNVYK